MFLLIVKMNAQNKLTAVRELRADPDRQKHHYIHTPNTLSAVCPSGCDELPSLVCRLVRRHVCSRHL